MRDIGAELKSLRLFGMATAWNEISADDGAAVQSARWLIEQLLQAEGTDRAMRSIRYQMSAARFPVHRDLAGFDFEQSCVERRLISELSDLGFADQAHNVVFVGGNRSLSGVLLRPPSARNNPSHIHQGGAGSD